MHGPMRLLVLVANIVTTRKAPVTTSKALVSNSFLLLLVLFHSGFDVNKVFTPPHQEGWRPSLLGWRPSLVHSSCVGPVL